MPAVSKNTKLLRPEKPETVSVQYLLVIALPSKFEEIQNSLTIRYFLATIIISLMPKRRETVLVTKRYKLKLILANGKSLK